VQGSLASGFGVHNLGDAVVVGNQRGDAILREHSIKWWVDFGSAARDAVELAVNEQRTLRPGNYGRVVVPAGAVLHLDAGNYRFDSLSVAARGVLSFAAGDIALDVAQELAHQGDSRFAGTSGLVLGYFGTADAAIDASFSGTVIAPNAPLTLGAIRNASYRGVFFARALEVGSSSVVEFVAPR
jgi:hypothetical protein